MKLGEHYISKSSKEEYILVQIDQIPNYAFFCNQPPKLISIMEVCRLVHVNKLDRFGFCVSSDKLCNEFNLVRNKVMRSE